MMLFSTYLKIGKISCRAVFILGVCYAVTTLLGFISLTSPVEPIGNPYFTIMEILTIVIAPLMAISMTAVHYYASPVDKIYTHLAVFFMFIMAAITSSVHFVILTLSHKSQFDQMAILFSFNWPSVVYVLDVFAWDWFFALSFLFAAPVFKKGKAERTVRLLLVISGTLSLAGLAGVPFDNMQIRNIGIIGYAVLAPITFLLIGRILGSTNVRHLTT